MRDLGFRYELELKLSIIYNNFIYNLIDSKHIR
jgi:hypothetical protein